MKIMASGLISLLVFVFTSVAATPDTDRCIVRGNVFLNDNGNGIADRNEIGLNGSLYCLVGQHDNGRHE